MTQEQISDVSPDVIELQRQVDTLLERGYNRRNILKVLAATAGSAAVLSLLASCGGEDDGGEEAGQGAAQATNPPATGGEATPTSGGALAGTPAAGAAATKPPAAGARPEGGSLIVAHAQEPDNLDPHVTPFAASQLVFMQIFDTLVVQTQDKQFHGALAESWEMLEGGKSWEFKLRQGVKFHDDTPFNAEAVKFSFDRMVNPETKSRLAAQNMGPYKETEIIDDHTIRVHFNEPFAPFLDTLSQAFNAPVSPAAVQQLGAQFAEAPVGTGPFKFKSWTKKDNIELEANPDYDWTPEGVFEHSGPPYLDSITFKFISEPATKVATLETGEVNLITQVPTEEVVRLRDDDNFKVVVADIPGEGTMWFMNQGKAPLDDVNVRRALLYAVDPLAINEEVRNGEYYPSESPLRRASLCWKSYLDMYPLDPDKTRTMLDEAGWIEGSDGIREKDGQKLKLDVTGTTDTEEQVFVQAQLRDVGVDLEVKQMTASAWLEGSSQGQFYLSGYNYQHGDPSVMRQSFHSSQVGALNWSFGKDEELDRLLDDGSKEVDPAKRCDIYQQAQEIIMRDAWIMLVTDPKMIVATRKEVNGVVFHYVGFYQWYYDVYIEE